MHCFALEFTSPSRRLPPVLDQLGLDKLFFCEKNMNSDEGDAHDVFILFVSLIDREKGIILKQNN